MHGFPEVKKTGSREEWSLMAEGLQLAGAAIRGTGGCSKPITAYRRISAAWMLRLFWRNV